LRQPAARWAEPGSRELAGSALFDPASARLTLYYTAAGRPGEARAPVLPSACSRPAPVLDWADGAPRLASWSKPVESVVADGLDYVVVDQTEGVPGMIKGFRDPAHFRDPADGGSRPGSTIAAGFGQRVERLVGLAVRLRAGIVGAAAPAGCTADDLLNEQERPHLICCNGLYYLVLVDPAPGLRAAWPHRPQRPLRHGRRGHHRPLPPAERHRADLAANPPEAPLQTYSWWVDAELVVDGIVDFAGVGPGRFTDDPVGAARISAECRRRASASCWTASAPGSIIRHERRFRMDRGRRHQAGAGAGRG
jgi:levansucrase